MQIKASHLFILAAISCASCSVYAVAPGLYMGLMTGPATNNASDTQAKTESGTPVMTTVSPSSSQFATRPFIGYKANPYAGFEMGFTFFSTVSYDDKGVNTCGGTNASVRDIDMVGRFSYPAYNFEPYVKAGAAAVYTSSAGGLNSGPNDCGESTNVTQIKPTFSLGLGYDMSQNWVADASANVVMVPGSISRMTYFALGLSYHFVDKYCGQFLCDD